MDRLSGDETESVETLLSACWPACVLHERWNQSGRSHNQGESKYTRHHQLGNGEYGGLDVWELYCVVAVLGQVSIPFDSGCTVR